MSGLSESAPFDELPEALVEEMLTTCEGISSNLSNHFKEISEKKEDIRNKLKDGGQLKSTDELSSTPVYPTSCGIDGSYAIERLVSTDISAAAAVAIEGLTPPGPEKRHWPNPRHFSHTSATKHSAATSTILRAIMMNMEIYLGYHAPHDVVFTDGSMVTPFIFFNQAITKCEEEKVSEDLIKVFKKGKEQENEDRVKFPGICDSFKAYETLLTSSRSDRIFAAVPKYTTKNEVCTKINFEGEDKGLLNFILRKDEFTAPLPLAREEQEWHIKSIPEIEESKAKVISALKDLQVVYYRPSEFFPVIRVEISPSVAHNNNRLAVLLEALKIQCATISMMEPYPLYLADRMVKHLSSALPAIRKTATQEMSLKWDEDLGNMYTSMHSYRTEFGK